MIYEFISLLKSHPVPSWVRAARSRREQLCGRSWDPEPSARLERCPRPEAAGCSQSELTSPSTPAEPGQQQGNMMKYMFRAKQTHWQYSPVWWALWLGLGYIKSKSTFPLMTYDLTWTLAFLHNISAHRISKCILIDRIHILEQFLV